MFQRIFDPENGFFTTVSKIMDAAGLSVMWLLCCIPVITIGPATAALYYSVVKCVRKDEDHPYRNFWYSFRANGKTGSLLTVICLLFGVFFYWEHQTLRIMASGGDEALQIVYFALTFLLLLPLGLICWIFPLLSRFETGAAALLRNSFLIAFRHLPVTLMLALLVFLSVTLTTTLWFLPLFIVTPTVTALLASFPIERVLKKYTAGNDWKEQEKPGTEEG